MRFEPEKFRNYYECPCGEEWSSTWSCMCNEKCSVCNKEIQPTNSEELCLQCGAVVDQATNGLCPDCGEPIKDFAELQIELGGNPSIWRPLIRR